MASVAFAGDPGTVNSGAGSTAGFQGVVLSGQVTRSTDDGLSIVITNTCFGTNLRFVTNPISPYSIVNMTLIVKDHGVEKKIMVKYPASLVTPSGGLNSLAIPASAISAPAGMNVTGAVSGNVVRLNLPIASSVTVDENGNISQASIAAELGSVSFDQEFETPGNRGQYSGPYYENGMKSSVNPDDYRGYTGPLSASVYTAASKDKKTYNVAAYFPGENGFCGGFFSPLMVFFDDKRPEFKASVDFPLNPSGKSMWPEAGAPGAFIAIDRDGDGKITKAEELFGNESGKYKNGFEALREFDSNKDGVIDSKDKDFGKLLLWFDKNGDGISQKGELVPLKTKIKSISLKYDGSAVNSVAGRAQVRERSSFIFIEKGKEKKGEVIDLWFAPENH
ncbi:EF-hand domain-containing protein [Bdellovibrio sp. NC01]|nr:EF-hand domain-containing protein [Bdellovibrio sp. NC01]